MTFSLGRAHPSVVDDVVVVVVVIVVVFVVCER